MSVAGFIQGATGEVKLADVLPVNLQTGSTLMQRKVEQAKYEKEHPGVLVVGDWEDIPDEVIVMLPSDEQQTALENRKALARRREERKAIAAEYKEPALGMDPDRAARELKRQRANLAGLTTDHPEYDKLFNSGVTLIHELERICGEDPTHYVKGQKIEKIASSVSPELMVKIDRYKKLPREKREKSIMVGENPELITLIRDHEEDPEVQELAVMRLAQLGAV